MTGPVSSVQNQAIDLMHNRKMKIMEKLKTTEAEEAVVTGGNAFTESVWNRMMEGIDRYLDEVKEEQKIRFEEREKQQEEKERLLELADEKKLQNTQNMKDILVERTGGSLKVPYGYLAKDGVIEYEGVIFVCDALRNAICLGDMTDEKEVLTIPLEKGGSLKVNRNNIGELARAIRMFSPEDIRRVMEAIATDAKCRQMKQEMEETANSITGSVTHVSKKNEADAVTAEQIAELFRDR